MFDRGKSADMGGGGMVAEVFSVNQWRDVGDVLCEERAAW